MNCCICNKPNALDLPDGPLCKDCLSIYEEETNHDIWLDSFDAAVSLLQDANQVFSFPLAAMFSPPKQREDEEEDT